MPRPLELRQLLVLVAGAAALAGASGLTEAVLFHQPSMLKYVLTVVGPLLLVALLTVRQPLALVTAVLLVAAPFAGLQMTPHGIRIPALEPILILGLIVIALSRPPALKRSALSAAAPVLMLTFLIPVVDSPARSDVLGVLASLFLAAYFAARVSTTRSGFLTLAWAFVLSAVFQAALAIWEHATGHAINFYGQAGTQVFGTTYFFGYSGTSRPPGAFYDPISLGNVLAIAIPLCVGLAIHHARRGRWLEVAGAAAASAVIVVALEMSLSRSSWIGAAIGLVAMGILLPPLPRSVVLPLLVLAVAIPVTIGAFSPGSTGVQRLGSILHPLNESNTGQGDQIRLEVWQRALSTTAQHPIAGVGFGRFQRILSAEFPPAGTQGQAQSTYLQLAVEGGIIAVVGLLVVLIGLGRDLSGVMRRDRLTGAMLVGASLVMLTAWTTDVTIRYSGVAVFMGVLFGMVAGRARWAAGSAEPAWLITRKPRVPVQPLPSR
jgi:O-antigen ligase